MNERGFIEYVGRFKMQISISVLLTAMIITFILLSPETFLGWSIYESFLSSIPFFAVPAIAMTLVVVCGEMDLCFPSTIAIGGFVFSLLWTSTGSTILALTCALAAGTAVGWSNGFIVVRAGIPSIVATIGTQFFWRGIVMLLSAGLAIDLSGIRDTAMHEVFTGRILGLVPAQALWALGIAVIIGLLLNRHLFGDAVRFTGDNTETALKMGVAVGRTRMAVFSLMGFLCALAGVMVCMEMGSWWPTQGEGYLLLVFASVFIGGTSVFGGQGSVYGTCIGAIIIGIIEAGIISAGLSGFWTRTVYGIIIVASVSLYVAMAKVKPNALHTLKI
jgi:simple sugar transport system permease protein